MFAPEWGFEVVSDELDGSVEAFVGWDAGLASGRMKSPSTGLRIFNIRHVFPIGVGACALAGSFCWLVSWF